MPYNPYFPVSYQPNYYQAYQPQYVQPQAQNQTQPTPTQAQSNGLVWVQGEVGAKGHPVAPNSTVMLMDSESDRFFLKSADASGMPLPLRVFEYHETTNNGSKTDSVGSGVDLSAYATHDEFEAFKAEIRKAIDSPHRGKREALTDE